MCKPVRGIDYDDSMMDGSWSSISAAISEDGLIWYDTYKSEWRLDYHVQTAATEQRARRDPWACSIEGVPKLGPSQAGRI